jgi:hypothetical protein
MTSVEKELESDVDDVEDPAAEDFVEEGAMGVIVVITVG